MSLARDLYKTKLCTLFLQRGHCPRQSCSFAHGEAELRKFPDTRGGGDLRDRLDRRHSPPVYRRRSPYKGDKGRDSYGDHRSPLRAKGHSHSRSPARRRRTRSLSAPRSPAYKRRERKRLRSDATDAHLSDVSGEDHGVDNAGAGNGRSPSPSVREALEEQVREVHAEKKALQVQKVKLEMSLQKKVQETTELSEKIALLESRLAGVQEDCSGLALKTRKFVKASARFFHAQEDLKKAQAKMVKLVEELGGNGAGRVDLDTEDLEITIMSDMDGKWRTSTSNLANHAPAMEATDNHLSSKNDDTASGETQQQKSTTALQEKRRASIQKALQESGFNVTSRYGEGGNLTNRKLPSLAGDNEVMKDALRDSAIATTDIKVRSRDTTPSPGASKGKGGMKANHIEEMLKAMGDGTSTDDAHDGGGSDTNDEPMPD